MSYFKTNRALKARVKSLEYAIEESITLIASLVTEFALKEFESEMDDFDASLKPKKKIAKKVAKKAPAKKAPAKKVAKKVAPKK